MEEGFKSEQLTEQEEIRELKENLRQLTLHVHEDVLKGLKDGSLDRDAALANVHAEMFQMQEFYLGLSAKLDAVLKILIENNIISADEFLLNVKEMREMYAKGYEEEIKQQLNNESTNVQ